MKGQEKFPHVDRNIMNNLVYFADNLDRLVILKNLENTTGFKEKWVKSATEWGFNLKYT